MWCGRKNCLNRADYSVAWKQKNTEKEAETKGKNDNSKFKIALAAMPSTEDFAALQERFEELEY